MRHEVELAMHASKQACSMNQCSHQWACAQAGERHKPTPLAGAPRMPRRVRDSTADTHDRQELLAPFRIAHVPTIAHTTRIARVPGSRMPKVVRLAAREGMPVHAQPRERPLVLRSVHPKGTCP